MDESSNAPLVRAPQTGTEATVGDLRVILWPAGPCAVDIAMDNHALNVPLSTARARLALDADRMRERVVRAGALSYFAKGTGFRIRVDNPRPQLIVEVAGGTMDAWLERAGIVPGRQPPFLDWRIDPVAADLARSLMRHLFVEGRRSGAIDALTLEALSLALGARAMARMAPPAARERDGDGRIEDARIRRAIDWAEAHLHDPELRIADMARAASVSSSVFSAAFRAATGETAYGYVLRRRTETACHLLRETDMPLAKIAFVAGFSSQAHMSTTLRRLHDTTPGAVRRER